MLDAALRWAMAHPLGFVAVLCVIAGMSAAMLAPAVKESIHNNHPRC